MLKNGLIPFLPISVKPIVKVWGTNGGSFAVSFPVDT